MSAPADPGAGYNVRNPTIERILRRLGERIGNALPAGWGFTLQIYSFGPKGDPGEGPEGSTFYIANCERADVVKAMREFIRRQEM